MEENWQNRTDHSILTAALIFFLLAVVFGLIVSRQVHPGRFILPMYVIIAGMFLFATSLETESGIGEWIASLSWTLNMFGFILFYQYGTGDWESWTYVWTLIFPVGPGLGQLGYGAVKAREDPFERGKVLVQIGLGLFALIFIVFKLFFQ